MLQCGDNVICASLWKKVTTIPYDDRQGRRHQQDTMLLAALDLAFLSLLVHQIFNLDPETYLVLEGQYLGLAA